MSVHSNSPPSSRLCDLGDTLDEVIENAKEAIILCRDSLIAHGEEIPTEGDVHEYLLTISDHEQVAASHS